MKFFKLEIAYEGSAFGGWQEQSPKQELLTPSVAAFVKNAIARATAAKEFQFMGSGRTDTGVHARAQVAHLRVETRLDALVLKRAVNSYLPSTIRVVDAVELPASFHALKDAHAKLYRYFVLYRTGEDATPSAFLDRWTWYVPTTLDPNAMREGLKSIVGEHDFAAFRNVGTPVKSTVREIFSADLIAYPAQNPAKLDPRGLSRTSLDFPWMPDAKQNLALVEFRFCGSGFLKQMVRNLVGHAVEIGKGARTKESFAELLRTGDRRAASATAPAQGLFLDRVFYTS